jgi:hypothetical protein
MGILAGREWEVVVGLQNVMREAEALTVNIYMTDPRKLAEMQGLIEEFWNKIADIGRLTVCGGSTFPCRAPFKCCKDGFCRMSCDFGPKGPGCDKSGGSGDSASSQS